MSLYLCVFQDENEFEGVEVGNYSDFGHFRDTVAEMLEHGRRGSRFPILMLHSDSDGEWNVDDCAAFERELEIISAEFKRLPTREFFSDWQKNLAKQFGFRPKSLYECFIDIDGEPLLERLLNLVAVAQRRKLPILFQ
jgi:hypothetical protein